MKNKFIATILTITLMASMTLVGCGSSAAPTGAGTQASSAATQESTADSASAADTTTSGEKTVIEYWHCNAETQGGTTVEELVNKFNEENDHIQVVAKYNPDMYKGLMQNLQAEATTGNTPALVQIGWAFLEYFSNNFG